MADNAYQGYEEYLEEQRQKLSAELERDVPDSLRDEVFAERNAQLAEHQQMIELISGGMSPDEARAQLAQQQVIAQQAQDVQIIPVEVVPPAQEQTQQASLLDTIPNKLSQEELSALRERMNATTNTLPETIEAPVDTPEIENAEPAKQSGQTR